MPKVSILSGAGEQPSPGRTERASEQRETNEQVGGIAPARSATNSAGVGEDLPALASKVLQHGGKRVRERKEMIKEESCGENRRPRRQPPHEGTSDLIQQSPAVRSEPGDAKENNATTLPPKATAAVLEERGQRHRPRDISDRERACGFPVGSVIGGGETDITTALTKIQALTGMVRAQVGGFFRAV